MVTTRFSSDSDASQVALIQKALSSEGFDYSPYEETIGKLRDDPSYMGIALARRIDGSLNPIFLRKMQDPGVNRAIFRAFDLTNRGLLGVIKTTVAPYHIFIDSLENFKREVFKDIGTLLIKFVLQESYKEYEGKVLLCAVEKSGPFYYKLGFRIVDEKERRYNSIFATFAEQNKICEDDFEGKVMFLPDRARALWGEEILNNPIKR